jgi:hypothetical protein
MKDNKVIDWDKLKCYGCGKRATRVHRSMVVPVCEEYPSCKECPTCGSDKRDTKKLVPLPDEELCPDRQWYTCDDTWHERRNYETRSAI